MFSADLSVLQFAYLQISTIIAALVRRLEFRLEGEFPKSDFAVRFLPSSTVERLADYYVQSMMVQPMPSQIMYRRRNFE